MNLIAPKTRELVPHFMYQVMSGKCRTHDMAILDESSKMGIEICKESAMNQLDLGHRVTELRKVIKSQETMKSKNILWLYVTILFIVSYIWQLAIFFTGGIDSVLFPFVMWFPGIIAIAFRLITKEGFRNVGWGLRKWWYVLPALFVPVLLVLTCIMFLSVFGWAIWSDEFFVFKNGMVDIPKVSLLLGNHTQSIAFFLLNFGLSLGVQAMPGSIFTLGEEFGWQGYLLQKLLRKYGLNWGLVVLGIIWGYWHLPVILMGYNFPNHPVLGALFFMPVSTIFMGIFQAWLYLRSKSIWMPVLAHASCNLTAIFLFNGMIMNQDELARQFIWITGWGVLAMICLISLNRKKPVLWQEIKAKVENTVSIVRQSPHSKRLTFSQSRLTNEETASTTL